MSQKPQIKRFNRYIHSESSSEYEYSDGEAKLIDTTHKNMGNNKRNNANEDSDSTVNSDFGIKTNKIKDQLVKASVNIETESEDLNQSRSNSISTVSGEQLEQDSGNQYVKASIQLQKPSQQKTVVKNIYTHAQMFNDSNSKIDLMQAEIQQLKAQMQEEQKFKQMIIEQNKQLQYQLQNIQSKYDSLEKDYQDLKFTYLSQQKDQLDNKEMPQTQNTSQDLNQIVQDINQLKQDVNQQKQLWDNKIQQSENINRDVQELIYDMTHVNTFINNPIKETFIQGLKSQINNRNINSNQVYQQMIQSLQLIQPTDIVKKLHLTSETLALDYAKSFIVNFQRREREIKNLLDLKRTISIIDSFHFKELQTVSLYFSVSVNKDGDILLGEQRITQDIWRSLFRLQRKLGQRHIPLSIDIQIMYTDNWVSKDIFIIMDEHQTVFTAVGLDQCQQLAEKMGNSEYSVLFKCYSEYVNKLTNILSEKKIKTLNAMSDIKQLSIKLLHPSVLKYSWLQLVSITNISECKKLTSISYQQYLAGQVENALKGQSTKIVQYKTY